MNSNEVLLFKDAIPDLNQPSTGKLTVTKNSSVQPVSLLRLGVFTPSCRTEATVTLNVTEALSSLEIAKQEGYTDIKITGPMLNYFQDFRCWTAIVHSFSVSPDALKGNRIKMPFSEFAKLCGYPSKRYSTKLRNEIADSLTKIRSKSIRFEKNPGITKFKVAGLLKEAEFDGESDYIILEADERLWDLYRSDHLTLLRKKPWSYLPGMKRLRRSIHFLKRYLNIQPRSPLTDFDSVYCSMGALPNRTGKCELLSMCLPASVT